MINGGLERAPEILVRFLYNKLQSRIERSKRRGEQQELVEETLGVQIAYKYFVYFTMIYVPVDSLKLVVILEIGRLAQLVRALR
tara:strand:- start:11 stop:262 length:252 start_codon:yes stop_codon:yes gene_type:complete